MTFGTRNSCYLLLLGDALPFRILFQLLHPIRSLDRLIIRVCLVLHLLDVFPVQIPKSSLLGRTPARYKSPCSSHHFFYHPHRPIHGTQSRNRYLHPLRPHRQVFVCSFSSMPPTHLSSFCFSSIVAEAEKSGIEAAGGSVTIYQ